MWKCNSPGRSQGRHKQKQILLWIGSENNFRQGMEVHAA